MNIELVKKLKTKHSSEAWDYLDMYNYYIGKTNAKSSYPRTDRSNRFAPTNHIKTFINEEVSFCVGSPITYVSKAGNEDAIKTIEYYINSSNPTLDSELATTLFTFGKAYELHYLKDGELKSLVVSPLNGSAYCNLDGEAELFLYFYKRELDDKQYVDVFDNKYIYHLDDNLNEIAPRQEHYFGCCPVGVSTFANGIYDTLYNDIKDLQDLYQYTLSDWANEISDSRLAYLLLCGLSIDEEQAKQMKAMGIIQVPDPSGKAEWLIKNINSDFIKSYRDIIEDEIYKVAQHLKHQIQVQSNTSGTMLANRLICLRNKLTTQQQCLVNCIKNRIKCLFTVLNLQGANLDYKDISVKFTLNIPSNDVEMADIISKLNGKLSTETALNQLSFITNGKEEFKKALEEQKQQVSLFQVGDENVGQ